MNAACKCLCTRTFFTTTPCMSDMTVWHQNTTQHSYLTAHISSMLEDTDTPPHANAHTHFAQTQALNSCQAPKAMTPAESVEGVDVDRTKAGGS